MGIGIARSVEVEFGTDYVWHLNSVLTVEIKLRKTRKSKMEELKETIELMNSEDYKERFIAEYYQVKIRYDKLDAMTVKYEAGTLNFTPSCSLELLKEQKAHMGIYIRYLKIRAEIEGINLKVE